MRPRPGRAQGWAGGMVRIVKANPDQSMIEAHRWSGSSSEMRWSLRFGFGSGRDDARPQRRQALLSTNPYSCNGNCKTGSPSGMTSKSASAKASARAEQIQKIFPLRLSQGQDDDSKERRLIGGGRGLLQ